MLIESACCIEDYVATSMVSNFEIEKNRNKVICPYMYTFSQ